MYQNEQIEDEMEELASILEKHGLDPHTDDGERVLHLLALMVSRLTKNQLSDIASDVDERLNTAKEDIQHLEDELNFRNNSGNQEGDTAE